LNWLTFASEDQPTLFYDIGLIISKAMEQLVEKGLCKAIGISNFTVKKTKTLLETAKIVPACNQGNEMNYIPHV